MSFDPVALLRDMIGVPGFSRDEKAVADLVEARLRQQGLEIARFGHNLTAWAAPYDSSKPTLMLNSHLDTVKPAKSYTRDPFKAEIVGDRLYGLGSNDAGASVVSLTAAFLEMRRRRMALPYNLLLALSVEEEVGGEGGMRLLLPSLEAEGIKPDMALVGEPTEMQPAMAERGLVVLDCVTRGVTGHAAREEGINAIYRAMDDIRTIRSHKFARVSSILGPIKVSVTQIEAGTQHNVVPDSCRWVADVRTTDAYSNARTAELLQQAMSPYTVATPRSTRVQASVMDRNHPLLQTAVAMGGIPFVSPTTSDMSLMHSFPSLKMGPGKSSRSHSADEFVLISEINDAVRLYIEFLSLLASNETLGQGL